MSIVVESVTESIASFKVDVEAGIISKLNEHVAAAEQLINPERAGEYEKLLLYANGGTLYLRFIPPRFGNAHAQTGNIGYGSFAGRSHPVPFIYLPGEPYRLVVQGPFAAVYYGRFLTWSGVGEQTGLTGSYVIKFGRPE